MSEQTSKYLILQFNQETKKMEIFPGGEWCSFKKDINYKTLTLEEAEEKMKSKNVLLDYIRNRGVISKAKKEKKVKTESENISFGDRLPIGRLNDEDEDMEDEVRNKLNDKIEEQSEEERPEDLDLDLKEIPSDIEEGFIKGKNVKEEGEGDKDDNKYVESSEDTIFGNDDDDDEDEEDADNDEDLDDQGFSEIDKDEDLTPEQANFISMNRGNTNNYNNFSNPNNKDQDFIGVKRKGDALSLNTKKKQKTDISLELMVNNIFSKNRKMTYEKLNKELTRDFTKQQLDLHLPSLLSKLCDKFAHGGQYFYFKKSEKY
jgi:hypothetical protein